MKTTDPPPHVYAVEWSSRERVFLVDGREHHREQLRVPLPRRHVVRSARTADYEAIEGVEPTDAAAGSAERSTAEGPVGPPA